jgi:tetratricopeptide (TPR) repeat protein
MLHALVLMLATVMPGPGGGAPPDEAAIETAERLAAEASALAAQEPQRALAQARRALEMTNEFNPTVFVEMGRKGEVVEDEFQAARAAYGEHRARLYETVGALLADQDQPLAASRYLRRAFLLDPTPSRGLALARTQIALGQGREALQTIQKAIAGLTSLDAETARVIVQAADVARLPSAQAEIDRGRLKATLGDAVTLRDGPVTFPAGTRLSTVPFFRLDEVPITLIYAAEASCRHCSEDLAALKRLVPEGVRVLALPADDEADVALRQVLDLYGYSWPLLLGPHLATQLDLAPRSVLVVARGGWSAAVFHPPFGPALERGLAALRREDVRETVPRAGWNRRPPDRGPLPSQPGLLENGLAPGEDRPFPPAFEAAVAAYDAGRFDDALKGFEALASRGDGWLLPPEARLDRALCLAGLGRRAEARRILLRTGDSRFEEAIDETLERVAPTGASS